MDHKGFENTMFDCVNRHSNEKEQGRKAEADAAREKQDYILRCQKLNAAIKIVMQLALFLCTMMVLFYLNRLTVFPPELPAAICGVVGLVTGSKVNALARAFRK